jgi:NADH:ubiquinone oxidoreductase subunit F (NADH-binding)
MPDNNNIFEAKLDDAIKMLQECQQNRNLESCYSCPECIGCEIRTKYVRTVYESMSKGETGGFDF